MNGPFRKLRMIIGNRSRPLVLLGFFVLLITGCEASSTTDGEMTTYKNSLLSVLGLLVIAASFLVFGIGIAAESFRAAVPRPTRKKRRTKAKPKQGNPKAWGGVAAGAGLTMIGMIILLLGVPSALLSYVKVGADRVVLKDELFWFAYRPQEIPYSSVHSIDYEETEVLGRRGKRKKGYLFITHDGGTERIEAAAIHRSSHEQLTQAYNNFRDGSSNVSSDVERLDEPVTTPFNETITSPGVGQAMNAPVQNPRSPRATGQSSPRAISNASNAMAYRGRNGSTFSVQVTGRTSGPVYGTDIYTDDSSLAAAAVHAGVIKEGETATVTFRILPGQSDYRASSRNGVQSNRWSQYLGSFEFVTDSQGKGVGENSNSGSDNPFREVTE